MPLNINVRDQFEEKVKAIFEKILTNLERTNNCLSFAIDFCQCYNRTIRQAIQINGNKLIQSSYNWSEQKVGLVN
ncbi:ubiquinone/menaquinone biosynthesis C-methylase UbiE [Chitinophaga sp. W3I9]